MMKIEISKKPFVCLEMDRERFKKVFSKTFDLKKAVFESTKIIEKKATMETSDERILDFLRLSVEWNGFFNCLDLSQEKILFWLNTCKIINGRTYEPLIMDQEKGFLTFQDKALNTEDVIITHSLSPELKRNLGNTLNHLTIDRKEWGLIK